MSADNLKYAGKSFGIGKKPNIKVANNAQTWAKVEEGFGQRILLPYERLIELAKSHHSNVESEAGAPPETVGINFINYCISRGWLVEEKQ